MKIEVSLHKLLYLKQVLLDAQRECEESTETSMALDRRIERGLSELEKMIEQEE